MKRILLSLILAASVLLAGASAGATGLQAGGGPSGNGAVNPSTFSSASLQPAGQVDQTSGVNSPSSTNIAGLLGAGSSQSLNNSGFSKQEILGEGDPSAPANSSSDWLPITFFVLLGLAVVLAGYLALGRLRPDLFKP